MAQPGKNTATPVSVITSEDIYHAGVWNFNLNQAVGNIGTGGIKEDGEKTGNFFMHRTSIEANYFFIDHVAVGAGFWTSQQNNTLTEFEPDQIEKINVIGGNFNAIYGNELGGVVNIITKAGVGFGQRKETADYGYGKQESKDKLFYVNLNIGSPIKVDKNVYFTPNIGYEYSKVNGENQDEIRNAFTVGLNMEMYMGCGDKLCECRDDRYPLANRYKPGEIILGSRMYGGLQIGGKKTVYQGDGEYESKDYFRNSALSGFMLYYILESLAVGAGLDYGCDRTSSKDNDYIEKQSELTINPIIRYNAPVKNMLKNLYGEASIGVGFNNESTDDGDEVIKDNAFAFRWKLGAGYNVLLSENFSVSPQAGYGGQTLNYKDNDYKVSRSGLYAGIGLNYHIRRRF
jgi:hypothetical protein